MSPCSPSLFIATTLVATLLFSCSHAASLRGIWAASPNPNNLTAVAGGIDSVTGALTQSAVYNGIGGILTNEFALLTNGSEAIFVTIAIKSAKNTLRLASWPDGALSSKHLESPGILPRCD